MNPALRFLAPLAVAGLVLTLGACAPDKKEGETAAADGAAATPAATPAAGDGVVTGIEGLATERDQVSYMIGMSLAPLKDDIDVEVLAQGMADAAADKAKLTEAQVMQVQQAFQAKLEERALAKRNEAAEKNATEGPAFLAANKDKPGIHVTESGLQYSIERAGNGPRPSATDRVLVNYAGYFLDGEMFDSSTTGPVEMSADRVIPGFAEALQLMPVGSKYTFWIPSELAYGAEGGGPVTPNAVLRFDLELVEIVK